MFDVNQIVRKNIKNLTPYSSARDEFSGHAKVFLDANENSLGSPLGNEYNRYPDPYQHVLKKAIGQQKNIGEANLFIGNGSDECIDLLFRCFCEPGKDNVIICPPTYGMYEVSARINDIEVRKAILNEDFQLDTITIMKQVNDYTRIIWICSPNNPTGNSMKREDILFLLKSFNGLIVLDEAYIDFSSGVSFLGQLPEYPNLVVLQTFSKAWGLAALRLGMAFADETIINILNKIKPPYNISAATQQLVLQALAQNELVKDHISQLIILREMLRENLSRISFVETIHGSDANFLLVQMKEPKLVYNFLIDNGIVVRNRHNILLCEGCLRITVGTTNENELLIKALTNYSNQIS